MLGDGTERAPGQIGDLLDRRTIEVAKCYQESLLHRQALGRPIEVPGRFVEAAIPRRRDRAAKVGVGVSHIEAPDGE
jgi:hypothetical protein